MAGVVEHRAVGAYHPVHHVRAVHMQRHSRLTVRKCRHPRRWAEERIPVIEEALPGDDGSVAPVERVQIGVESRWAILLMWLKRPNHHTDQCSGARQLLPTIE